LQRVDPFLRPDSVDSPSESCALLPVEPEPFSGLSDPDPQVLDGITRPHHHDLPHALVRYPFVLQSAAPNVRDQTGHHQGRLSRTVGDDRNKTIGLNGLD
jgi:hypothetical protein